MTSPEPDQTGPIPSSAYTREYYETCCQGYEEFQTTRGGVLPLRLSIPLELAQVSAGMQIVDIGCGRGELILHCARQGASAWGLDYAHEAVRLTGEALQEAASTELRPRLAVQQADATRLPFAGASADRIFMLDVVEHLTPEELSKALDEAWRILKPGGQLIIHTMPNLWYYRYGYPLFRLLERLRGKRLPADPRDRWAYRHVHVNEQNPRKLRQTLDNSRFSTRVWLRTTQSYDHETSPIVRQGMKFLTGIPPFRWIFCNDIFAIGTK